MKKIRKQKARMNFSDLESVALKKIFRMVRFTVFCFFLSLIQVMAVDSYSQMTKLSLNANNEPLENVLGTIEDESEFFFLYNKDLIDVEQKVNIKVENETIKSILDDLLKGKDISYAVYDRQIVLSNIATINEMVARQKTISGTVTDETGQSLPGVTVVIKGTTQGTVTNMDGNYSIPSIPDDAILVFSFVGMRTQEIVVGIQTSINITMLVDAIGLEEVIAIGYGTQKKENITGAIATISNKEFKDRPVIDFKSLLEGRVAGVAVNSEGQIRIRGVGTINDSNPLYVVDGIFMDDIGNLNPSDVESLQVLKDAASAGIYGARGANGVILITTKRGDTKDIKINVELASKVGVMKKSAKPNFVNSAEWYETMSTGAENAGNVFSLISPSDDVNRTTDWVDAVYRTSVFNRAGVSLSRGDKVSDVLLSAAFITNKGNTIGNSYDRVNLRFRNNYTLGKFKTGIIASFSRSSGPNFGLGGQAMEMDPLTPIYKEDGTYASTPYNNKTSNPLGALDRLYRDQSSMEGLFNYYLQFEPIENLIFKTSLSMNAKTRNSKGYNPIYDYGNSDRSTSSSLSVGTSTNTDWLIENTVNYNVTIAEDHSFNFLAGFTAQEKSYEFLDVWAKDVPWDGIDKEQLYISATTNSSSVGADDGGYQERISSYLARVNYNYANKYYLTASVRRDGASVFGPDNRFGVFPAVSVGWKLRNENFMNNISEDVVSRMMLRVGWGRVGNSRINPYGYLASMQSGIDYTFGGVNYAGVAPTAGINTGIQWETVETTNIGIDLGLFKNKMNVTLDYYIKDTKDMLLDIGAPKYTGVSSSPFQNIGTIQNKGIEMTLGYNGTIGSDFSYSANFNISHVKNKIKNLNGDDVIINKGADRETIIHREGNPIGTFYGYKLDGVFQTDEEAMNSAQKDESQIGAGDFRYVDQNNDGKMNQDDQVELGSPFPDFTYGLSIDLFYKNFDARFFFVGEQGLTIWNGGKYDIYNTGREGPVSKYFYDNHWTKENGSNDFFGFNNTTNGANGNLRKSDWYLEDWSYCKLKNLQIGYNIKEATSWLYNIRLYFSVDDLFTIKNFNQDERLHFKNSGSAPLYTTYSFGANILF